MKESEIIIAKYYRGFRVSLQRKLKENGVISDESTIYYALLLLRPI